jgi:hypothetical protein
MAEGEKSFPKIAEGNWWKLRDHFKRRVPAVVTPASLASALDMSEPSARSNIMAPFKKIGIFDEEGKPTDLAYDWRDDTKYPSVCKTILEKLYPREVLDLYHDINQDFSGLSNWFMNYCRCGDPAAKMYSSFYRLLLRADPNEQSTTLAKPNAPKTKKSPKKTKDTKEKLDAGGISPSSPPEEPQEVKKLPDQTSQLSFTALPQLHINIQLHISPETTSDQIDKIFESMARHLKSLSIGKS